MHATENIHNSGMLRFKNEFVYNNNHSELALNYLNNLRYLKNNHDQFNYEFVFALIQTKKIPEAFSYLKKINKKNINFFEANLLLGINYFLEKKYQKSANHFNLIINNNNISNLEQYITFIPCSRTISATDNSSP